MMRRFGLASAVLGGLALVLVGLAQAGPLLPWRRPDPPTDAPPPPAADSPEEQARAGYPQDIRPRAKPSDTGRYAGYYVGGGSLNPRKGELPGPDEGTWGWDYVGGCFKHRVILNWWHGRRTQGGVGRYEPDGPRVLPPLRETESREGP
jgi:hypothetical protein